MWGVWNCGIPDGFPKDMQSEMQKLQEDIANLPEVWQNDDKMVTKWWQNGAMAIQNPSKFEEHHDLIIWKASGDWGVPNIGTDPIYSNLSCQVLVGVL